MYLPRAAGLAVETGVRTSPSDHRLLEQDVDVSTNQLPQSPTDVPQKYSSPILQIITRTSGTMNPDQVSTPSRVTG